MSKPPQVVCPNCGALTAYDPKFVFRPVQCAQCGQTFTPGYARLEGTTVPPPLPASHRRNGRWLWIGGAAIAVLMAVVIGVVVWQMNRTTQPMASGTDVSKPAIAANPMAMQPTQDGGAPAGRVTGVGLVPGQSADGTSAEAQGIRFENLNFTFESPSPPWIKIDAKPINPVARLAFTRRFPEVYFCIIAENAGYQITNDALAEIAIDHLRAGTDNYEMLERQPQTVDGIDGLRLLVRAEVHGVPVCYAYWIASVHGYFYQLIAWGGGTQSATVEREAIAMWQNFHLIDPNRQAGASTGELLASFHSADSGISMDLSGLGWRRSATAAKALASAILCGERSTTTFFTLQAFNLGDLNPPIDYIARAASQMHEKPFDEATNIKRSSVEGVDVEEFEESRILHSVKCWEYYEVLARPGMAYLLRAESTNEADMPELRALSNQIHLNDNFTPSDAAPTEDVKKSQKLMLNSIGIAYENTKQFGNAAKCFAKAFEYSPELVVLDNLVTADEMTQNYRQALAAVHRGVELWPSELALVAREAKLQVRLNELSEAATTYHDLFATDYRDDDAFHEYLLLLQKLGRKDDAIAAASAYLAKANSEQIGIDQALLYDVEGQHDRAAQLLMAMSDKVPNDSRIETNLAMVLVEAKKFDEAEKVTQQLISTGNHDADTYLLLGQAQMGLSHYREAKASFETAQQNSPDNPIFRKWVDAASAQLGEGDNSSIQSLIDPVKIPSSLLTDDPAHPLPAVDTSQDAWYERRITAIDFVPKERLRTSEYRLIKVLTQQGVENFSNFQFPFDPLVERIYLNKLEVRDGQGNVVATTSVSHCFVTDENQAQTHSFRKLLNVPVEGLNAGSTLELLVTHEEISPPAEMRYTFNILAGISPGGLCAVYLTGSLDSVKSAQSAGLSATPLDGGLCWSVSPMPQYHTELQQPPSDEFMPYVALGDKAATWKSVAKTYLDLISSQLTSPDTDITALAGELTRGLSSDAEKVDALAKYVQHNYAYTAVEFGRRARIPNAADDIIHKKSGDCKDHALLLLQLLRAASIPAHLVLANFEQNIQPDLPSLDQFTHMIVCVPSIMPNGFFDCTDKSSDIQRGVPLGLGNRQVLVLDPEQPRLARITDYPPNAFVVHDDRSVSISAAGDVSIDEDISLNGSEAAGFRHFLAAIPLAERPNQVQQFLTGRGAIVVLHDLKVENLEDASQPLGVKLNYSVRDCFRSWSGQMVGSVPALMARYLLVPDPVDHRLTPFLYSYPVRLDLSSKINLPASCDLDNVPSKVHISDPYSLADAQFSQVAGVLTEEFSMGAQPFERTASDYNDFQQSRQNVLEAMEPLLHLVKH